VNPVLSYAVVEVQSVLESESASGSKLRKVGNILNSENKLFVIVASDLISTLETKWSVKLVIQKSFPGSALEHCRFVWCFVLHLSLHYCRVAVGWHVFRAIFRVFRYTHPVNNNEYSVVLGGDYITTESGTGLVHTAPGHGQEDYQTGLKYGLPIISPVDDEGNFTAEAGQFSGLSVLGAGNAAVVKYLDQQHSLILEESYS
jgi:isoleucyl-tRNA synthetase